MKRSIYLNLLIVTICSACTQDVPNFPQGKWIDLTHDFDENSLYWPTAESFKHDTVFEGITDKGFYYSSFKYSAEEHGGTHFDAPVHFVKGRNSVEKVPIEQLMGEAIVVDISAKALKDCDYQVIVEDFVNWEQIHGEIPEGAIILLYTGYSQFWPDRIKYLGTDMTGPEAVKELHFPGLHPQAAKWLITKRKINAIGLDTPSIDYGQSTHFESHRILFEKDVTVYENVTHLDLLPSKGAWVIALPMKIKGGSGAPLRILALVK